MLCERIMMWYHYVNESTECTKGMPQTIKVLGECYINKRIEPPSLSLSLCNHYRLQNNVDNQQMHQPLLICSTVPAEPPFFLKYATLCLKLAHFGSRGLQTRLHHYPKPNCFFRVICPGLYPSHDTPGILPL